MNWTCSTTKPFLKWRRTCHKSISSLTGVPARLLLAIFDWSIVTQINLESKKNKSREIPSTYFPCPVPSGLPHRLHCVPINIKRSISGAVVRDGRLELPTSCSQSKRATNCANPGYEIQTDPTAGCSNSGVCLQMATPQNLTAVHVACRKRTECRRKTILYFTEICRKVKSYIEEAPCPYGHGALILATAAAIAAAAVVAAAPTAAAAAAPDDDQQNDDPAAVPAASATVITAHIGTSYEIEM